MGKNTNSILAILFAGLLIMLSGCNLPVSATPTSEHPTLTETITPTPTASPTPERTPERQYLSSPGLIWFEMTDATHGWGMNLDSVLRTEDGGEHWYVTGLTGILELPYRGRADFLDAQVGWVLVADPLDQTTGQIYRTADGGESWQQFETPFARERSARSTTNRLSCWSTWMPPPAHPASPSTRHPTVEQAGSLCTRSTRTTRLRAAFPSAE
jgi:hypothetical protein